MDEQQILSTLKARVARHENSGSAAHRHARLESISDIDTAAISRVSADVWVSKDDVGRLNPRNPGYLNELVQAGKRLLQRSLTWYTRSLQGFHSQVARAVEEHGTAINSIDLSLRRLQSEIMKIQDELPAIEQSHQRCKNEFLQSLRTTEVARREQLAPYIDFFRGSSLVVDLGCGRGEFLVLLREHGISAYGVDSDRAVCEVAGRESLKIVEADVFEHLRQLPEQSLGGVFSSRLIEYLPVHLQADFITLCSKKVRRGGVIVIETISPESNPGFGRTSYLDPTRLRAISPLFMRSIFESSCLRDVRICVLAPVEAGPVSGTQSGTAFDRFEWRDDVRPGASNNLLDSPAYAAIAWRS
jgi:SAM-dependent methyltransferase